MSNTGEQDLIRYLVADQDRFYRLAYSYLHHQEDALDAVQTAVCRALERQDSLRNPAALRAWFYHILVNSCLDILRQRGKVVPLSEWQESGQEDPPSADESLAQQIDALPEAMGTVIKLRFYEELSLKEIGIVTGCNINTVKSRLYSGLKRLRISMEGAELV